jgi:hypothetical protein
MTQQQRSDPSVRNNRDIARRRCSKHIARRRDNAGLSVLRAFPPTHAFRWTSEERIGHDFKFRLRQVAGGGSVVLAQTPVTDGRQTKIFREDGGVVDRFTFRAARDVRDAGNPALGQHGAHTGETRGLRRHSGTGTSGSINTSGRIMKNTASICIRNGYSGASPAIGVRPSVLINAVTSAITASASAALVPFATRVTPLPLGR